MKVLLVGNYPLDAQESMLRFARLLAEGLPALGVEVSLIQPQACLTRLMGDGADPHRGLAKLLGYADKFLVFPLRLWRAAKRSDLVHICDHSNAMYGRWTAGRLWGVTCHDLLAVRSASGEIPENPVSSSGRVLQRWILSWLQRAPWGVCDSGATREDLLRLTGLPPERVMMLHIGLNHPYQRRPEAEWRPAWQALQTRRQLPSSGRFLLHVGGHQWYKNRAGVLRLFAGLARDEADLQLVIAGKKATPAQRQVVAELGLTGRIHFVGAVDNDELELLYHAAEFLLFPSKAEGFGWPVVEAQACGCRVAASNRAPLPEVGGDSVVYFDPDDEVGALIPLRQLLAEMPAQREARCQAGLVNAQRFRAATMLEGYAHWYRRLLNPAMEGTLDECAC